MKLLDIYEKSDMFKCAKGGEVPIETASLFVSGIVLREIFFPEISFENSREEYSFEQVWFMLCLYHDKRMESARAWERACQERKDREIKRWETKNINVDYKWKPMQLCFSPLFRYSEEGIQFTNGARVTKCILSETEVRDYFYFRNTCCLGGGMDHGIAGGLLLYENLMRRHLCLIGNPDRKTLDLYSYAANTMLVHNICRGNEGGEKITIQKDPMLFLLLLTETLEPLQYAAVCEDYEQLLGEVEVEIGKQEIRLMMNPTYFEIDRLVKSVQDMGKKIELDYKMQRETARICITL